MSQAGPIHSSTGGSGGSDITQISGNTGIATPVAGNVNIVGALNTVTSGSGSTLTINVSPTTYAYTPVTTTPYVALTTDYFLGVHTTSILSTIRLPNAPVLGRTWVVKDSQGFASSNPITVTTVGGTALIDGATSYVLDADYQAAQFIFNGTGYDIY